MTLRYQAAFRIIFRQLPLDKLEGQKLVLRDFCSLFKKHKSMVAEKLILNPFYYSKVCIRYCHYNIRIIDTR